MYQQITIIGNLGRDPETKWTKTGKSYAIVSVAASRSVSKDVKETVWFKVTAWENAGQYLTNYAKKGSTVMVVGRLFPDASTGGPRIWTDSEGNPRAAFEVVATDLKILSGWKETETNTAAEERKNPGHVTQRLTAKDLDREDNDDYPLF